MSCRARNSEREGRTADEEPEEDDDADDAGGREADPPSGLGLARLDPAVESDLPAVVPGAGETRAEPVERDSGSKSDRSTGQTMSRALEARRRQRLVVDSLSAHEDGDEVGESEERDAAADGDDRRLGVCARKRARRGVSSARCEPRKRGTHTWACPRTGRPWSRRSRSASCWHGCGRGGREKLLRARGRATRRLRSGST